MPLVQKRTNKNEKNRFTRLATVSRKQQSDRPGSDVQHVVDPQHPLEVQAQAECVVVRHEPLEAGVEVRSCTDEKMKKMKSQETNGN